MSKRTTLSCLLILLISACTQQVAPGTLSPDVQRTQPAPSKSVGSEAASSVISAWTSSASTQEAVWTSIAGTKDAIVRPTLTTTDTAIASATAAFSLCPGAPGPYVSMGKQVTVVSEDVDPLKLRSTPEISPDNVLRNLNRFTRMRVVGGPVCVRAGEASYWFWQVQVERETGWVAEGDVQHAFIAVSVGSLFAGSTATAYTATTPLACTNPRAPIAAGAEVTVTTDNSDKLKLRSEPEISPETVIQELDQFTRLEIVGGPTCIQAENGIAYWLWKVKVLPNGRTGWVAQGDGRNEFIDPLIPP